MGACVSITMTSNTFCTTAAEMREHLQLLLLERALAGAEGHTTDQADQADLDDEIATTRTAYVGAAVTEIASLRAQLSGQANG